MAYQKCPVCDGSGKIINNESTAMYDICPVCKGACIIDEQFGTPPKTFTTTELKIDNDNINKYIIPNLFVGLKIIN